MIKLTTFEALLVPFLSGAYSLLSGIHSLVALWAESSLWWLERHFVWKIHINSNLEKHDFVRLRLMFWKYRICLYLKF